MNIVVAGFGTVGQNLAQLLLTHREFLRKAYGLVVKVVAVVDSKGAAVSQRGLDLDLVLRCKREHGTVAKRVGPRPCFEVQKRARYGRKSSVSRL